jgi:hypothetical protein
MSESSLEFYNVVWLIGLVTVIIYLGLAISLNSYMRNNHAAQWDELGRPTFLNNSIANHILFLRFFMFGSLYRSLNNKKINRYVFVTRIFLWMGVVLFVALIFILFRHGVRLA